MKKFFAIISGLTSVALSANPIGDQPALKFAVYDVGRKVAKNIGKTYSLSNKNHRLCWTAFNMPFNPMNNVVETFVSPAPANFRDANGSTTSSKNRTSHTIKVSVPNTNNTFIERCWLFDKKDPKGIYRVDIQVNDIIFPTQTFKLTK